MFQRYTEQARRVLFSARYEASQYGSRHIETGHLLLGLLREDRALAQLVLPAFDSSEAIRREIESEIERGERISTAVEIPLTPDCKRILNFAVEEAERLGNRHIGTEHLLLGILSEEPCLAARVLAGQGVDLEKARAKVAGRSPGGGQGVYVANHVPIGVAVDAFLEAWLLRDAKKLASIFTPHGRLWDVRGELWLTRPEIEKGLAAHFAAREPNELAPDIRDVQSVSGAVSVATLVWESPGEGKKRNAAALRMALVLCDSEPGWLIVSAHMAILQPGKGS